MIKKGKGNTRSIVTQILIAMPLMSIILSIIAAKMVLSGTIQEANFMICVYAIVGLVSFLVSMYCALRMKRKKVLWGMATACGYMVMLILGNLLFFGVGYGEILPTCAVVLSVGCAGSLIGAMKRRHYA